MKKNKISKNWVNKQRRDTYVRQSKIDGYRARSVYKLIEIDEKFKIFKGGMSVIDIGAAPGSWSQYVSKTVKNGKLISFDLKDMENIKNIDAIYTGELCKEAMIFSKDVISDNGFFISKIFMGATFNEIVAQGKSIFREVKVFKPKSSRKDSKESFIICKNLR